jgi:hypothetical protein
LKAFLLKILGWAPLSAKPENTDSFCYYGWCVDLPRLFVKGKRFNPECASHQAVRQTGGMMQKAPQIFFFFSCFSFCNKGSLG